jgi:hypothetical protein
MSNFKDFFDHQFEENSKKPKIDTPWGKARSFTRPEVDRAMRESLIEGALSAVRHYKNTSPKYILGKMGYSFGAGVEYEGIKGNAMIITEMIQEGILGINSDGKLYEIK